MTLILEWTSVVLPFRACFAAGVPISFLRFLVDLGQSSLADGGRSSRVSKDSSDLHVLSILGSGYVSSSYLGGGVVLLLLL